MQSAYLSAVGLDDFTIYDLLVKRDFTHVYMQKFTQRGKRGVARLCVLGGGGGCVCAHVWMQGWGRDRVRYITHY